MSNLILEAQSRVDMGKGASRRLRRLENLIPAILYGGEKKPQAITLSHIKINKILEDERVFTTVLDLNVDGKVENVILKDMHRHPYKPIILHMDFQRVSAKDVLIKNIPLHFINEDSSKAAKAGGIVTHTMTQIEVRCQVRNLPEFIEVDLASLELDDVIHLADLKLPSGVHLTVDLTDGTHNHPVVSAHAPKAAAAVEETVEEEAKEQPEADTNAEEQS